MADSFNPTPAPWQGNRGTGTGQPAEGGGAAGFVETVKDKAKDVAAGTSELVSGAKDKVREWASEAADTAGQVKNRASEMATTAAHKAEDFGEDLTGLIRRYPVPALLVGFGIGFLLAQLSRRD